MDNWIMIILEAEDRWACSSEARYYTSRDLADGEYKIARDSFKARHIYNLYGYEYFLKFVERCPHINFLLQEYPPCEHTQDAQCSMFCINYTGGCKYATE